MWWTVNELQAISKLKKMIPMSNETASYYLRLGRWNVHTAIEAYRKDACQYAVTQDSVLAFFMKYCDINDNSRILSDGVDDLLHELDLEASSIYVLLLAWKCRAKVQWIFTRQEFCQGMLSMQADNVASLKEKLALAEAELQDEPTFKSFYEFTFEYAQDMYQRVLDIDMAIAYWKIVLEQRFIYFNEWLQFLEQTKQTAISKDSWNLLWEFVKHAEEYLTNYDINEAWPVIIDEFVQWFQEKQKNPNSLHCLSMIRSTRNHSKMGHGVSTEIDNFLHFI